MKYYNTPLYNITISLDDNDAYHSIIILFKHKNNLYKPH